jgi:hypothetical protein
MIRDEAWWEMGGEPNSWAEVVQQWTVGLQNAKETGDPYLIKVASETLEYALKQLAREIDLTEEG